MSDNLADLCEQAWFSGANDAPDLWGTFAAYLTEHGVTLADPPSDAAAPLRELLREAIETVHQTGSIRDHADPSDRTGWNVHGIETCADPLCVEALAALTPTADTPKADLSNVNAMAIGSEAWKRLAYMCPNCVTPWKCNGPHIPEGEA